VAGTILRFDEPDPLERRPAVQDDRLVVSPVAGLLRHLAVAEGDRVADGDLIAVIEAMKMETPLTARLSGCVGRIGVRGGEQVAAGEILIEIVPDI
jgi:biotin carboxyl carrier protein